MADELVRSAAASRMEGGESGKRKSLAANNRYAKLLLGEYNLARFRDMINFPRDKFRLLVPLYTGHCRLKKHLANMGITSCGTYRFRDMEPETPEHLILNCTAICRRRLKALGSIYVDRDYIT